MFEAEGGTVRLWQYAGTGTDWRWTAVAAHAALDSLEPSVQAASFQTAALGGTKVLNFQIRALDAADHPSYDSYVLPLTLNNTGLVFDITNHP